MGGTVRAVDLPPGRAQGGLEQVPLPLFQLGQRAHRHRGGAFLGQRRRPGRAGLGVGQVKLQVAAARQDDGRGHTNHGWLDSWHTFSFADYHDPAHMGFRTLRVINDDTVAGGGGFDTHPHRDMEILSYVLRGATPGYVQRSFAEAPVGRLQLVASQTGRNGSLSIHQDAEVWLGKLAAGDRLSHRLPPGRHAWLQVAEGHVTLNGLPLAAGDGAAIGDEPALSLAAERPAQALLFDLH